MFDNSKFKIQNSKLIILAVIIIIAAFFRLYNITDLPPGLYPDEAMNGNNALESGWKIFYPENNGREGLFMNIQAVFLKVLMPLSGGNLEPWMLRFPSAIFGILTVLGVYFLTKELFCKNLKQQEPQPEANSPLAENNGQIPNPNEPNSKIFGIWNLEFGISRSQKIALLSSFFLATSFWHINFSRIGFRAIMAPFFLVWAVYFLLVSFKKTSSLNSSAKGGSASGGKFYILNSIIGGLFFGLGFYSYIAYRVMPLLIAIIFFYYLYQNRKFAKRLWTAISIYVIAAFIIALPIGIYFLKNPADFFGRTVQISVGVSQSPVKDLAINAVKTLGMFNFVGDGNWRHNIAGAPEMFWPVGILFIIGIILGFIAIFKKNREELQVPSFNFWILFSWFVLAMLPVIISNEGIPHALRSILLIPPAMIFAGAGGVWLYEFIFNKIQNNEKVRKSLFIICGLLFVFLTTQAYYAYFIQWGKNPNVQGSFAADYVQIGKRLNALPKELPKYVLVEAGGVNVRGIPMPTQTVMFITDTFTPEKQKEKNIFYVLPEQIIQPPSGSYMIVLK